MIDVKKFAVTFLLIAIIVSSSVLLLSGSRGPSRVAAPVAQNPNPNSLPQGNAFMPQSVSPTDGSLASAADATSPIDPNNLTENFANSALNDLLAANPNGPRDNGDGTQTVTAPAVQAVLSDASGTAAFQNLQAPNWDFAAALITTRIATSSSQDDNARYMNALSGIIETYFVKTNLQAMVSSSSPDPQNLSVISSNLQGALSDAGGLTAPKDLADFHKAFIKLLVYEKNATDLVQNASDDPLKALLTLQSEKDDYQAAVQGFQDATQKAIQDKALSSASLHGPSRADQNGALALFNKIFGIPEAHAFSGVGDVVFDPITEVETSLTLAQIIWQFLQSTILQMLKNFLVLFLEKLVLAFIQNGGNPRFLQSWSSWASSAFNIAAGNAFGQIVPGLCPNFSGDVTGWLKNAFPSAPPTQNGGTSMNGAVSTNCTLQGAIGNVSGYYNDFNTAGFDGFGALLAPNNNPFGTFAQAYDSMQAIGGSQQSAATNKALGGTGYKGTEFCTNGSTPNPLCSDGSEPFVTTPGTNLADTMNRNLNSSIDLIVNANDWTGLLVAVTGALLQQFLASGNGGIVGTAPPATQAVANGGGVTCQAQPLVASSSASIAFGATGAVSSASWSVPGGNPANGSGISLTTKFAFPGIYTATVTVTDATGKTSSANCSATIN
jgi:hypothetical protein